MKRKSYGRDRGLTLRMFATGGLLGLLYVVFAVVLLNVLNVGLAPMLVIVIGIAFFQYYTSDKLALAASGATIVTTTPTRAAFRCGSSSSPFRSSPTRSATSSSGRSPAIASTRPIAAQRSSPARPST